MTKPKALTIISLCILFCLFQLTAPHSTVAHISQDLVAEAWQALQENNQALAETKLTAALKQDPNNLRASLTLYFLYELQWKNKAAWAALKPVLLNKDNAPYQFAEWNSTGLSEALYDGDAEALAFYNKLTAGQTGNGEATGTLKAMAHEHLGEFYRSRGNVLKSDEQYKQLNNLKPWLLSGPFENVSASGFDKAYPPETEAFAADKAYEGKNGTPAQWFAPPVERPDQWLDFTRFYAAQDAVFYANTFVQSPKKQTVQMRIGTSGSVKFWLNDELALRNAEETDNDLDTYVIETTLQEGWNRLLIKTAYSEPNERVNFMLRLTDAQGAPIPGLQVSTAAQKYPQRPQAAFKTLENFAEAFFKARIQAKPDELENYLLLADTYLINDKATEAELILKEALKRAPRCGLIQLTLLGAYNRGNKTDEYNTTLENLRQLDKNLPTIISHDFYDLMERKDFDKAEVALKEYERLLPKTTSALLMRLAFYDGKEETTKANALLAEALRLYPNDWNFVERQANLLVESTKRYTRAILLVEQYLTRQTGIDAQLKLAELYLAASNVRKWNETYERFLATDPASPNQFNTLTETYVELKDYANAEKYIRKALALCPTCSGYWASLGQIQQARKQTPQALESYRTALKNDPFNFNARRILRELEGKPEIWSLFEASPTGDVKKLIAAAPDAKAYPESPAVFLLYDAKRVVYADGASEQAGEYVIKIFNKQGIDALKEQVLPFNTFSQSLNIEKAVSIKPNGNEIKADVSGSQVVFKSLEENDIIHIQWKTQNYNSGKLYKEFWDVEYFNRLYPVKQISYSLLAPANYPIAVSAQNMPKEPTRRETEAGIVQRWALQDVPAVELEVAMPTLDEVGKVLYVSSLTSWESLVNWYAELARAKTESTYEIKEAVKQLLAEKAPRAKELSAEEKIEQVYNFITENIRYSSVPFRQSGLVPQKARDVLVTKIGDCKDVSTLGIAMLNELGVKSYYTLVNTRDAGTHPNAVPAILFNHCIIAAETGKGLRYLDLTAHNYPATALPLMDKEALALLIKPGVTATTRLPVEEDTKGTIRHTTALEVQPDLGVKVEHRTDWLGAAAAYPRMFYRYKGPADIEKNLTQMLAAVFPGVKLQQPELKGLTEPGVAAQGIYRFTAPGFVSEAGGFKLLKLPWFDRLAAFPPPSTDQRKHPYVYETYAGKLEHQIQIKLPAGYEPLDLGKDVALTSSVADFKLSFAYANGVITVTKSLTNKKLKVLPEEYAEFKQFFNRVVKEEDRAILLKANN